MENSIQLLTKAFEAQRKDRNIGTRSEYRIAGIEEINGSPFRYTGELPYGVREFVRSPACILGQGDPYLVFDEPLDMDLMEQSVRRVFGRKPVLETDGRASLSGRILLGLFNSDKYLFRFWREKIGHSGGTLEYYTDTSAEEFSRETPKVVEAIARYLELMDLKRGMLVLTDGVEKLSGSSPTSGKSPPTELA